MAVGVVHREEQIRIHIERNDEALQHEARRDPARGTEHQIGGAGARCAAPENQALRTSGGHGEPRFCPQQIQAEESRCPRPPTRELPPAPSRRTWMRSVPGV
jgi:hypothetical protein